MSYFDSRAAEWDSKPRRVKLARDVIDSIIKYAKPEKGLDISDFGTGTGLILLGLREYALTMTGYDTSEGMLSVLSEKAEEAGILNLRTVLFDVYKEDFPADSADLLTCSMVMHHLEDHYVFFEKAYKALRIGGKLCVADLVYTEISFHDEPPKDFKSEGFKTEDIKTELLETGFKNVQVHTAAVVEKERDGEKIEFPVFLAVAEK